MQTRDQILEVAKALDDAIETREISQILPYFAEDCRIELLSVTLSGHDGARKFLEWMFQYLVEITLEPIVIIVEGNIFFEEFIVHGKLHDGRSVKSPQAEVLEYDNLLVKSLRLYFDRLDFADAVASGWLNRKIIQRLIKISTEGLV
jgi:ketosteroid isomerase-like protein